MPMDAQNIKDVQTITFRIAIRRLEPGVIFALSHDQSKQFDASHVSLWAQHDLESNNRKDQLTAV